MSELVSPRLAILAILAISAAVSGCATHQPDKQVATVAGTPVPVRTPRPAPVAPTATAIAAASAAPTSTETPVPSVAPAPTAASTPAPSVAPLSISKKTPAPTLRLAADAAPQILDVALSSTAFGVGDTVSGTVTTSSNVASVEARIATFGIDVPKTGVGRFTLRYQVPNVPFFMRGNYTMRLIARNARGDRAERDVSVSIR